MKSFMKVLAFAALCLGSHVEAKSYGSSSSSRSSSSSSSSRSSSSSYSKPASSPTKPTAAPSSNSYSKPNTAQAQTSTRPTSKADVARYQSAAKSGKVFTTRESAVADFKTKNASTYTSRYNAEPAARPDHIPRTYRHDGQVSDVSYNPNYGGYGYWSGGNMGVGQFLLYDALSDAAMTNTLMSKQNYYVGAAPVHHGVGYWLGITIAVILSVIIIAAIISWLND